MVLADVNMLFAAFRTDHADHAVCRRWLDATLASPSAFGVSDLVLSAVVRLATDPRVMQDPNTHAEVFEFANSVRHMPHAVSVAPGVRHWEIFQQLCVDARATRGLVTDAWFAALAIEHGCEWITLDGDFARFPGLKWRRPQ